MLNNLFKLLTYYELIRDFSPNYTEDQKKFLTSGSKCPNCDKNLFFYHKCETRSLKTKNFFKSNTEITCKFCNYRWTQYSTSNELEIVDVRLTIRTEEILDPEKRLIDNSRSSSRITRKIAVSREWSKSYSIQYDKTERNGVEFNIGMKLPETEVSNIKVTSEETLRKLYSVNEQVKQTYNEEVQIEVPAKTKTLVIFRWKYIFQHGIIKFRNKNKIEFDVPFKVGLGITFDQSQNDT